MLLKFYHISFLSLSEGMSVVVTTGLKFCFGAPNVIFGGNGGFKCFFSLVICLNTVLNNALPPTKNF